MTTFTGRFQVNRKTATQWTSANTVLLAGELGVETDTLKIKVGNGTTAWTSLPYLGDNVTAGVSSFNGRTGAVTATKTDVGLANVDNTSDANKPVSTAQAAALATKTDYPTGGVNGQSLVKNGTTTAWATIGGGTTAPPTVRSVTASTTFVLGDAENVVQNTGSTAATFTVPTNTSVAYPIETSILVRMTGTGVVTVAAASGVTINTPSGYRLTTQYAQATLTKTGTDTWLLGGLTVV